MELREDSGSHEDLLALEGVYARMHKVQQEESSDSSK